MAWKGICDTFRVFVVPELFSREEGTNKHTKQEIAQSFCLAKSEQMGRKNQQIRK